MRPSVTALIALMPFMAFGQVVINPTGGTNSSNGIRLTIGNTGQIQVLRNGTGQLYNPSLSVGATTNSSMTNGVFIAVGNVVVGPRNFASTASTGVTLQEWTPISNIFTPQGSGGTTVTVLRATVAGKNYDLTITWQYTFPNDFVVVTHSLLIPAGNTSTVRLYHVADAFLGGDDFGPSFFSIGPPALVGGYRPANNIVEAWRFRSGLTWTGYFAGFYACLFDATACPVGQNNSVNAAGTFTNYVEGNTVDNSFGIMWNFGAMPGTYVTVNDLTFYSYQPQLSKRFGTTAITAGLSTTLTFTVDNVPGALPQSNMGFTDTFPSGLVIASSMVTNTCGGTVTTAEGALLSANATTVRLSGGSFAAGTSRCTITVNVTANTADAYINGKSNMSALSVMENQVTDQTLSVVVGAPVVTLDTPGTINTSNATAYPIAGTCQDASGLVTVRVSTLSSTTPCSSNRFSVSLSLTSLSDGTGITVSASQTNTAGTGIDSASTTKDTSAPAAPTFTAPVAGSFSNTPNLTIAGSGEVGSTVRVFDGTTEICSAVVPASGNWSCISNMLTDGTLSLTAKTTDPAGNTGPTTPARSVVVDTTAPAEPTITSPAAAATVGPNPPVSGNSEPDATVLVFEGGTQVCSTPADPTGQWSCATSLSIGSHTVVARQIDRAGNSSVNSAGRTFSVANVPTVTLDTPAPINIANVTAVVVSGACTTVAGMVSVQVGTVSAMTVCTASRFSTSVNASSLADGPAIVMTASQTNVTGTGTDTRNTIKDTVVPATPTIVVPIEGTFTNTTTPVFSGAADPGSTVRVSRGVVELCNAVTPSSGQWACTSSALLPGTVVVTARATDGAGNTSGTSPSRTFTVDTQAPSAPVIVMPVMSASVATSPMLVGTAEPFSTVSAFEGVTLVCSVVADATGAWSCGTLLSSGPHSVVARQTDRAGNTSPDSPARAFTVEGLPTVLLNPPGDITGGNASAYVVTGGCTSNAGQVTVEIGTITAMAPCASGTFSATVDVRALSDDAMVVVRATQTTAAGMGTDSRTVRKDATAPLGTAITQPMAGAVTTSNTPSISGTGEPGVTVTIFVNGNPVGTALVGSNGTWNFTPGTPIADGTYVLTASAKDSSGNEGPKTGDISFTIDSVAPMAPTLISPAGNATADTDRPLDVTGIAEPGAIVTVYIDDHLAGTAVADELGHFSLRLDPATLGEGIHVVEAQAKDAAGNTSPRSASVHFTVRAVEERFGGQGLVSCSATGNVPLLLGLALLGLIRRREVRS